MAPNREGHMASHIERRKFLATLGGAAASWPLAARAQQPPIPVIGFLSSSALADRAQYLPAFRQGVRETGYNDFRLSIPLIPPATLSKRLKSLQEAGVIERVQSSGRGSWEYRLTDSGMALKPFLDLAGEWGQRWVRSQLLRQELHPSTLMWDVHRFIKTEHLPKRRVVIYFEFPELRRMKRWWLVIDQQVVDVCLEDPGYDVDLIVSCDLRTLTQIFMGDLPLSRAKSSDRITLFGDSELIRTMGSWFGLMPFSGVKPQRLVRIS
jgi:DNA-binding HxlR family transcriptional regulator